MSMKNSKKIKKNEKPAHIVLLCYVLMIQVDKQGLPTFIRGIHVCNVISQISSHEVKCEDKWYEVWNMKRFKSLEMDSFRSK